MEAATWQTATDKQHGSPAVVETANTLEQLVQGLPQASPAHPQGITGSTGADQPSQLLLQSLLSNYGPAVMVPPPVPVITQHKRSETGENAMLALQSTLNAAIATGGAGFQQVNIAQPTQVVVQQPQTADAMQLAALLAAMQDPHQPGRYVPGRALTPNSLGADPLAVAGGLVSKASSGDYGSSSGSAREKNRQAQQRFRQRQKDRIKELEDINKALQDKLSGCEVQLAELRDENKLLRAKLEGQLQLLETFQGVQQQTGLLTVQLPGVQQPVVVPALPGHS